MSDTTRRIEPELTIALCGDIMLGAEVAECMGAVPVTKWLEGVSKAWSGADLLIANLESPCVLHATPNASAGPTRVFHAPARRLAELAEAGFSALTLANNHILNCGPLGLRETMQGLDQVGIAHAGAGMTLAEALQPTLIRTQGITIGLVAFCYGPPASRSSPGVAPNDPHSMRKALSAARVKADLVIAVLHDGLEYSDVPPSRVRARFRFLAEQGADIVVGHHPHVLQGLEWYSGVPIAYSLGNFIFDSSLPHIAERSFARIAMGRFAPEEVRRDPEKFSRGAVLTVHFAGAHKSVEWHPFRQDTNLRPQLSTGEVKAEDLHRLEDLSAALLNERDPRHWLADSVVEAAWWEDRDNLRMGQLLKLALRPKWRYVPCGFRWLWRRI
jgi:poly-gamma-glutamate capsule biosynthesis protein CapA/YwtB (metallophosphatase superfamily)